MATSATLTFSTISTVANAPIEAVLFEDIEGQLELERSAVVESDNFMKPVEFWRFYPSSILSGVKFGTKAAATDELHAAMLFTVHGVEPFGTHQEIVLRRVGL